MDMLQPDLTRCGGFTAARKIVHMAERANRLVIPHSWSSDLLTAASLHLNAFQRRGGLRGVQHLAGAAQPGNGEANRCVSKTATSACRRPRGWGWRSAKKPFENTESAR